MGRSLAPTNLCRVDKGGRGWEDFKGHGPEVAHHAGEPAAWLSHHQKVLPATPKKFKWKASGFHCRSLA